MGVRGLATFLDSYSNTKYAKRVFVRDCPVVIDGYNLVYHLYQTSKGSTSHLVGGDYKNYATEVRLFFQKLKNCEIIPIVIFDGAYEESKLATVHERFQNLVKENVKQELSYPSENFTPLGIKVIAILICILALVNLFVFQSWSDIFRMFILT